MSLFSSSNGIFDKKFSDKVCNVYIKAKQTWLSFPMTDNKAVSYFDLIHCNIQGENRIELLCRAQYFMSFIDGTSRRTWVYLMKDKREVHQLVMTLCMMVKTQFNANVKIIRSDSKREFVSGPIKTFHGEQGIIYQTSCVDSP